MEGTGFLAFMRNQVLPHQAKHPEYLQLDGKLRAGNLTVFGKFSHAGQEWEVHADTRLEPLKIAYHALAGGIDPFMIDESRKGRRCLILKKRFRPRANAKYLYVYGARAGIVKRA